jgi:hypothetical protein
VAQIHGTVARGIEVAIHPHESLSGIPAGGWRVQGVGKAAVQMPGKEEPFALGILVGKAAARGRHLDRVGAERVKSQINVETSAGMSPGAADWESAPHCEGV